MKPSARPCSQLNQPNHEASDVDECDESRRQFVVSGLAAASSPLLAFAQVTTRVRIIAVLSPSHETDPFSRSAIQAFQGMLLFFLLAVDVLTHFRVRFGTAFIRKPSMSAQGPSARSA